MFSHRGYQPVVDQDEQLARQLHQQLNGGAPNNVNASYATPPQYFYYPSNGQVNYAPQPTSFELHSIQEPLTAPVNVTHIEEGTVSLPPSGCKKKCSKVAKLCCCCGTLICLAMIVFAIMSMVGAGMMYKCLHPKYTDTQTFKIDASSLTQININAITADIEFYLEEANGHKDDDDHEERKPRYVNGDDQILVRIYTGAKTRESLESMSVRFESSENAAGVYNITVKSHSVQTFNDFFSECQITKIDVIFTSAAQIASLSHKVNINLENGRIGMEDINSISDLVIKGDRIQLDLDDMSGLNSVEVEVRQSGIEMESVSSKSISIIGEESLIKFEDVISSKVAMNFSRAAIHLESLELEDAKSTLVIAVNEGRVVVEDLAHGTVHIQADEGKVKVKLAKEFCGQFALSADEGKVCIKGDGVLTDSESDEKVKSGKIGQGCEDASFLQVKVNEGKVKVRVEDD